MHFLPVIHRAPVTLSAAKGPGGRWPSAGTLRCAWGSAQGDMDTLSTTQTAICARERKPSLARMLLT
jgi:hypothetical protein